MRLRIAAERYTGAFMALRYTVARLCSTAAAVAGLAPPASSATPLANATSPESKLHLMVHTAGEPGFNVTSTLVYGATEALLVDAQYHTSEAAKLADEIAATGRHLKAIFITHPDLDHYLGLEIVQRRFPGTPVYMSAAAVAEFQRTVAANLAAARKRAPSEAPDSVPAPRVLPAPTFVVDGDSITVVADLQGDVTVPTNSFLWIPSLRAVIAGDIVFDHINPWLADSTPETRAAWQRSLERIAALKPRTVVAGHQRGTAAGGDPATIAAMAGYLTAFDAARKNAANADSLAAVLKRRYPDWGQAAFLGYAAKAAFATK